MRDIQVATDSGVYTAECPYCEEPVDIPVRVAAVSLPDEKLRFSVKVDLENTDHACPGWLESVDG